MKTYNAIDLFAGIGGIRIGFNKAFNDNLNFVFSSEMDERAQETYNLNFNEYPSGDITKIKEENIPVHDILLGGFPCQAFSIAGHQKGFLDTRGTLFFDIVRIVKFHNPEVVFLENVKNLQSHDGGRTFKVILETLKELDYKIYYQVLNAKNYDLPQNRERIYIVCFKNKDANFSFPKAKVPVKTISSCLQSNVDKKYYYEGKPLFDRIKDDVIDENIIYQWRRKYVRANKSGVCPTLTANMGGGGHNVPIIKDKYGLRKLTPRECGNFQGFPSSFKLPDLMADSHLYKQFGNSVPVSVIFEIAKEIKKTLESL